MFYLKYQYKVTWRLLETSQGQKWYIKPLKIYLRYQIELTGLSDISLDYISCFNYISIETELGLSVDTFLYTPQNISSKVEPHTYCSEICRSDSAACGYSLGTKD